MKREVLDGWCERGILALVLAILVLGPLALGAVRGLEFAVLQGLTLGVMLLWGMRLWLSPRAQLLWPPICWVVLAFSLYALARYCTSDIEYLAREELLHVLVYAFLFFAILNNLQRQETIQIISLTLIFLAMAIAFYAFYQFVRDSDYVWRFIKPYPHRGSGTYICPNHLAGFLEMLLPLSLAYTLTSRLKPVAKILTGYAALAITTGIAVSLSRGGWLSTALALLVLFGVLCCYRGYRLPALLVLALLMVAGFFIFSQSYLIQMRLKQLPDERSKVTEDMRFALWQPAIRMWEDHPWWGVGPAHYDARFRGYRPEGVQLSPLRTHNDYLNTLADWGLAGTALVALAWVFLGLGVFKTWPQLRLSTGDLGAKSGSNKFAFVVGASAGLLAILFHSAVDFNLHIPANAILAVALMALLSGCLRFATERYWIGLRGWSKCLASVVLAAGIVYLAPQGWRMGSEFVWLDRAARAARFSKEQVALLNRAFRLEPMNPETAYAIGEALRWQSQEGNQAYEGQEGEDYRKLAERALEWFERSMRLNPWDSRPCSGAGWCLDWLDRQTESPTYFSQAEQLDPNNYYNLNNIGLHYVQLGNYAASKPWFERSLRLELDNAIAWNYLQIANTRLLENATNQMSAKLGASPSLR
jgi:O-antigen ligase